MAYKVQINDSVRDATPEEAAWLDAQRVDAENIKAQREATRLAALSARAKLAALGLTEAEVAALLGA